MTSTDSVAARGLSALTVEEHIQRISDEGDALARAAEAGPLSAAVPGCPGWDVDALLRHIGDVHRWAATIVRDQVQQRLRRDFEGPAERDALLDWYRDGVGALVGTLTAAPPESVFWFWGPAPNAVSFWARRQANETTAHRCDAESARGALTPIPTEEAVDCLDEWIWLIPERSARAAPGRGRIIELRATDTTRAWQVRLDDPVAVVENSGAADCTISGGASDLYLWSMNRRGAEGLEIDGDTSLVDLWSEHIRF